MPSEHGKSHSDHAHHSDQESHVDDTLPPRPLTPEQEEKVRAGLAAAQERDKLSNN